LAGEPKRINHPKVAFLIAIPFMVIILFILGGVIDHLVFSHHGPRILKPVFRKVSEKSRSSILEEVRRQEEYEIHRHFHNIVKYPQLPESLQPACFICHSEYPHSKDKRVRALLNMHTQYIVCETCHIDTDVKKAVVYKWYNPFTADPKGPFLGTRYDPDTGNLLNVENKFSKIAPFYKEGDQLISTIHLQDAPLAKDYMTIRDRLSPDQRGIVTKKFHSNIKPKGHECQECHTEKGLLNFEDLEFSNKRAVDLRELNIAGMITKYEKFYLPNLFRD